MTKVKELETSGWIICVGDVFSNGYEEKHLKVIGIERDTEKGFESPDDAKIHCLMVDPNDHNKVLSSEIWHRAWYINECWYK